MAFLSKYLVVIILVSAIDEMETVGLKGCSLPNPTAHQQSLLVQNIILGRRIITIVD